MKVLVAKNIVAWLDHSQARLFTFNGKDIVQEIIEAAYDNRPRERGEGSDTTAFGIGTHSNNEYGKHIKEKGELQLFYKELEQKLANFDHLILIGPSTAKNELHNILKENKKFDEKSIEIETTDKLTENQLMALVKKHLS